ncbi:MAG TPA: hypothetical protein VK438_18020 [Xanthobacteraceae bacterium]|nr:hypothetical protein [Xanthobacteraceae bacterium]
MVVTMCADRALPGNRETNPGAMPLRTQITLALALGALVVVLVLAILSHATLIADETTGDIHGIDIFGITDNAKDMTGQ